MEGIGGIASSAIGAFGGGGGLPAVVQHKLGLC